jgi:hypothetical protein
VLVWRENFFCVIKQPFHVRRCREVGIVIWPNIFVDLKYRIRLHDQILGTYTARALHLSALLFVAPRIACCRARWRIGGKLDTVAIRMETDCGIYLPSTKHSDVSAGQQVEEF